MRSMSNDGNFIGSPVQSGIRALSGVRAQPLQLLLRELEHVRARSNEPGRPVTSTASTTLAYRNRTVSVISIPSADGCSNTKPRDSSPIVSPRSVSTEPSSSALSRKSIAVWRAVPSSAVVMRIESITQHTNGSPPLCEGPHVAEREPLLQLGDRPAEPVREILGAHLLVLLDEVVGRHVGLLEDQRSGAGSAPSGTCDGVGAGGRAGRRPDASNSAARDLTQVKISDAPSGKAESARCAASDTEEPWVTLPRTPSIRSRRPSSSPAMRSRPTSG